MSTLEIRHQILMDGDAYVVREIFGDQPPTEWSVPDRAAADTLVATRRDALKAMISAISPDAKSAVDDAREIDNLKAGNA